MRGPIVPLGTVTSWGKVDMVGITGGERYYWMTDRRGVVSMMPADVVEKDVAKPKEGGTGAG